LLRMTDTVTSQNIDLSSWDTLYIHNSLSSHVKPVHVLDKSSNVTRMPSSVCFRSYSHFYWQQQRLSVGMAP
jgi:hypothetical protein